MLFCLTCWDELDESSALCGESPAFSTLSMESMHCSLRALSPSMSYTSLCRDLKRSCLVKHIPITHQSNACYELLISFMMGWIYPVSVGITPTKIAIQLIKYFLSLTFTPISIVELELN